MSRARCPLRIAIRHNQAIKVMPTSHFFCRLLILIPEMLNNVKLKRSDLEPFFIGSLLIFQVYFVNLILKHNT